MRTIERTKAFKRDFRREARGAPGGRLEELLIEVVTQLANDAPLSRRLRDHAPTGDWKDHRDCHVTPDLILIYRKPDHRVLQLVRLGSHSELSL